MRSLLGRFATILIGALAFGAGPASAENPKVIRFGYPGVGVGNRPFVGGSTFSTVHGRALLEAEFKQDGIPVAFTFFKGAGPALNEAAANGLLDIWHEGDLPAIVARAGGLRTKVLLASSTRGNQYVAVPADSPVTRLEELKGRRVAVFKGTTGHLHAVSFFAAHGLAERDLRLINMDTATGKAALATKDIDALVGGTDLIELRNRGIAKIIYSTRGDSPTFFTQGTLIATEDFIKRYPHVVQRIVNVWVAAARWNSEPEHRQEVFQNWARSGTPYGTYKEDYEGIDLKVKSSPLLDDYIAQRYRDGIQDSKRFGYIRAPFAVEDWFDPTFLAKALKTTGLENYWVEFDAEGRPKSRPDKS